MSVRAFRSHSLELLLVCGSWSVLIEISGQLPQTLVGVPLLWSDGDPMYVT